MTMNLGEKVQEKVPYHLEFPKTDNTLEQDEEWCLLTMGDEKRKIRFHDYHELYEIPGLYEDVFYNELKCQSPQVICSLLQEQLEKNNTQGSDLHVIDVGAGNGMVGEELANMGSKHIIGVDIIQEAKDATYRDRPTVYKDYLVADLTDLSPEHKTVLREEPFNCLTTVAALGFGDIPPRAFAEAYNAVCNGGWIAFNIKDRFLEDVDPSGFCKLIRTMKEKTIFDIKTYHRYRHRLATDGTPLYYIAVVAQKKEDISEELLQNIEQTTTH